jgi:hypothetical protein
MNHFSWTEIDQIQLFARGGYRGNLCRRVLGGMSMAPLSDRMVEHLRRCNECYAAVLTNGRHEHDRLHCLEAALADERCRLGLMEIDLTNGCGPYIDEDDGFEYRTSDEV